MRALRYAQIEFLCPFINIGHRGFTGALHFACVDGSDAVIGYDYVEASRLL